VFNATTSTTMLFVIFRPIAYALFGFAAATILVMLRRRLRQRHLWNIPGPSNTSLVWGNIPCIRDDPYCMLIKD
jgi:hypothetical protein